MQIVELQQDLGRHFMGQQQMVDVCPERSQCQA
jgi:hypothetical protein